MTGTAYSKSRYQGVHVQLDIVSLRADESRDFTPPFGQEGALVLVEGAVDLDGEPAQRESVFEQRATAVYLPPGSAIAVDATTDTELAFVSTRGYELVSDDATIVVRPEDVVVQPRGEPGWERDVHDVIADAVPARRLLVGETFNEPGQWSSFPPHKHDGGDGEPALEEVYYYRFDRPGGFGFQGLYEANGQAEAVFVEHGSIVGIPRGYHPVCAAPGYRLYYLWALVGDPRQLAMHEDPVHRWLHDR
jgi:5-deoxy-glucuronate isomerase